MWHEKIPPKHRVIETIAIGPLFRGCSWERVFCGEVGFFGFRNTRARGPNKPTLADSCQVWGAGLPLTDSSSCLVLAFPGKTKIVAPHHGINRMNKSPVARTANHPPIKRQKKGTLGTCCQRPAEWQAASSALKLMSSTSKRRPVPRFMEPGHLLVAFTLVGRLLPRTKASYRDMRRFGPTPLACHLWLRGGDILQTGNQGFLCKNLHG